MTPLGHQGHPDLRQLLPGRLHRLEAGDLREVDPAWRIAFRADPDKLTCTQLLYQEPIRVALQAGCHDRAGLAAAAADRRSVRAWASGAPSSWKIARA
jgi:hypothetical protein